MGLASKSVSQYRDREWRLLLAWKVFEPSGPFNKAVQIAKCPAFQADSEIVFGTRINMWESKWQYK